MTVAIPSTRTALVVGNRVFTDLTNLKALGAACDGANRYSAFRLHTTTSGYQVPASTTFQVYAFTIQHFTATNAGMTLYYQDSDNGFLSTTAPTNPVYTFGSNSSHGGARPIHANATYTYFETAWRFSVPTTKYLGTDGGGTNSGLCRVYGYEE